MTGICDTWITSQYYDRWLTNKPDDGATHICAACKHEWQDHSSIDEDAFECLVNGCDCGQFEGEES